MALDAASAVEEVYRSDWGRIVATLIRMVGDFDLAEECAQEAFTVAIHQWPLEGIPEFPRAWIIQTARHKAIDQIRRQSRTEAKLEELATEVPAASSFAPDQDVADISDDQLRLIFTCCHPALATEAQVALTLRTLCGLQTDEIARAFLVPEPTMAQRLVRAKRKIRAARIPYVIPQAADIPERLDAVLTVLYLVFNEGYAATRGDSLIRTDLCSEAIRLGRLLRVLLAPNIPSEVLGLLALMLLQDARRDARHNRDGDIIILEEQDRTLWNQAQISEALPLVLEAFRQGPGPLGLQAAIAALHCRARRPEDTDWPQILRLYDLLNQVQPSPVVLLNRAVAVGMVEGPDAALSVIDAPEIAEDLDEYHLLHAVRADMLRRVGRNDEAAANYERALALVTNASERRFLERRLDEVRSAVI